VFLRALDAFTSVQGRNFLLRYITSQEVKVLCYESNCSRMLQPLHLKHHTMFEAVVQAAPGTKSHVCDQHRRGKYETQSSVSNTFRNTGMATNHDQ
jgi:hypothetical protein